MSSDKLKTIVLVWLYVAFSAVLFGRTAAADVSQLPEPLKAAIEKLASHSSDGWAYTRETRDDIGHYVERFDPNLPRDQQWSLVFFDGDEPTEKHRKRYTKEYDSLFERDSPIDTDLSSIIDPTTLVLEADNGTSLQYSFQPTADEEDDARIVTNLIGKIVVDTISNDVVLIEIRNKKKFSPAAMVRINSMFMKLEFEDVDENGPRFVHRAQSATEGRFMGLKKFAESEDIIFSHFAQP